MERSEHKLLHEFNPTEPSTIVLGEVGSKRILWKAKGPFFILK